MGTRAERAFREGAPMDPQDDRLESGRPDDGNDHRLVREHGEPRDRRQARLPDPYIMGDTYVSALQRGTALMTDNVRNLQDETARFMSRRLERHMEAMEDIARSRSLLELFGIQQKWLSGIASDYGDEMIRLARMAGNAVEDSVERADRLRDR
jgi:hypothetical protein